MRKEIKSDLLFLEKGLSQKKSSNPTLRMNKVSPENHQKIPDEQLSRNVK